MDLTVHIIYRMVYHFMLEFIKAVIGLQCIGEDRGAGQNVLADFLPEGLFLVLSTNLVRTLLPRSKIPMTAVLSLPPVLVILRARFAACIFRALPPM